MDWQIPAGGWLGSSQSWSRIRWVSSPLTWWKNYSRMVISLALASRKNSKSLCHGDSVILKVLSNLNDSMACFESNTGLQDSVKWGPFFQNGRLLPQRSETNLLRRVCWELNRLDVNYCSKTISCYPSLSWSLIVVCCDSFAYSLSSEMAFLHLQMIHYEKNSAVIAQCSFCFWWGNCRGCFWL